MKRIFAIILIIVLSVFLCACGDVSGLKVKNVESKIFSKEDINSAVDTVKDLFYYNFSGCSLKEIYYAGDSWKDRFELYKKRYNSDEVIILLSRFCVDSSGGDGSLSSNETYDRFSWILARNNGGQWEEKDHGY